MKHFLMLKTWYNYLVLAKTVEKSVIDNLKLQKLSGKFNVTHIEMEFINYEKQHLVNWCMDILVSLENQDNIMSKIRNSVRSFYH